MVCCETDLVAILMDAVEASRRLSLLWLVTILVECTGKPIEQGGTRVFARCTTLHTGTNWADSGSHPGRHAPGGEEVRCRLSVLHLLPSPVVSNALRIVVIRIVVK